MITVPRRYRYVVQDRDRHGNLRTYLRRPGWPKVRLQATVGTDEFDAEYRRVTEAGPPKPAPPPKGQVTPGTVHAGCVAYYGSTEFKQLAPRTQRVRRLILDHFCEAHGAKRLRMLERRHVVQIRDKMAERPEAANGVLKAMRAVFRHAVSIGLADNNPAAAVSYIRGGGDGFHTWSIEEVRQFEAHWPIGSKARLALALLLLTGQRRSDVVQLGRQHVRDGVLTFTQVKNRSRKPVRLVLPIVPELAAIMAATPGDGLTFLTTELGTPYTPDSFGNRFRAWARAAGVGHCTPHGLRKAAAVRLAELGASAHELKAVLGHKTLKEVERYTRQAEQAGLARSAFDRMALPSELKSVPPDAPTPEWDDLLPQAPDKERLDKWMVPKGGVEPPTLRFSVACSTS